ncbi:hypothetical protein GGC63_000553 [Paenibacillus sp. OAS669]|nr:hypothetical protein [Paenibacillus sp. OAS669]
MPRRSLRPPLKPVKIPLNIINFHGFQQRLEGHTPPEYTGNSSSSAGFSTKSPSNGRLFVFKEKFDIL